jgi:zinc protease
MSLWKCLFSRSGIRERRYLYQASGAISHLTSGLWLLIAALWLIISPASAATPDVYPVQAGALSAWLIPDDSLPVISVRIDIPRSGSAYDPEGKEGLAALTAAMLTEGAGSLKGSDFRRELDFYAIELNTSAGRDELTITMRTLSEHKGKAFELLGLMLSDPRFSKGALSRIRAEHLATLERQQESPAYRRRRAFYRTVFAGHPYGRPHQGTAQSVRSITTDDLRYVAANVITQPRLRISVAGDINSASLQTLLEAHLGTLPSRHGEPDTLPQAQWPEAPNREHVAMPTMPQTSVQLALPGIARSDKDFYAAYLVNHLLGGGSLSSRLGEALRQERGLTYSVGSQLAIQDHAHWFNVYFSTRNAKRDEAITAARNTLTRAANQGFTPAELQAAKDHITGEFTLNLDTNDERTGYLASMQRYDLGRDYLAKRNDYMRQVSLDQLNRVAASLLSLTTLQTITVGGTHDTSQPERQ